jgi:hypothetical protein
MALLEFPNPVAWFEGVKDENQKRDLINSAASALYSAQITFLWSSGKAALKWRFFSAEGPALMATATALYLTLTELQKKGFLTLTVPKDLLEADNLAQFQTEEIKKT